MLYHLIHVTFNQEQGMHRLKLRLWSSNSSMASQRADNRAGVTKKTPVVPSSVD